MSSKYHVGQVAVSAGVIVFGVAIGIGAYYLPEASGYSGVGPRLFPALVAIGMIPVGAFLLREALSGGFHDVDEVEQAKSPTDWMAFGLVTAGLMLDGMLINSAGFVISGTLLFVLAARGLGSSKYLQNAIIGALIAGSAYAFFTYLLGLSLPKGILPI